MASGRPEFDAGDRTQLSRRVHGRAQREPVRTGGRAMRSAGAHAGQQHGGGRRRGQPGRQSQKVQLARNRWAVWCGFLAAVIGYAILAIRQVSFSPPFALVVVPALAGLIINRIQASDRPPRQAFFAGLKGVGWAMLFYASISLTLLANGLGSTEGGGQRFL